MATGRREKYKSLLLFVFCWPGLDLFWPGLDWGWAVVCVFSEMDRGGKGRMPNASCESGQAFEKAQNGNGQLLEKVGMDLGLAPRRLGFGAMSVWGWRRAGLESTGPCYAVNAIRALSESPRSCRQMSPPIAREVGPGRRRCDWRANPRAQPSEAALEKRGHPAPLALFFSRLSAPRRRRRCGPVAPRHRRPRGFSCLGARRDAAYPPLERP
jgi:hypothetical protein